MPFHAIRHPKVYVPNQSFHDFSDAERYGELVFLTQGTINRMKINNVFRQVATLMADADAGDYLLVSGPTTVNMVAASLLAYRFGRLNLLLYDGYAGRYMSHSIVLSNMEPSNDGRYVDASSNPTS